MEVKINDIQPLHDYLLVEPAERGITKSESGIYLPGKDRETTDIGRVVGMGKGRLNEEGVLIPIDERIKIGTFIVYLKYKGMDVEMNGKTIFMVKEEGVIGIIKNE